MFLFHFKSFIISPHACSQLYYLHTLHCFTLMPGATFVLGKKTRFLNNLSNFIWGIFCKVRVRIKAFPLNKS